MNLLLWLLAIILIVAGTLALFRRQLLWGLVLIIVGLLIGPTGVSIFSGTTFALSMPEWFPTAAWIAGLTTVAVSILYGIAAYARSVIRRRRLKAQVQTEGGATVRSDNVELRRLTEFTMRRSEAEEEIAPFLPPNPRTAKRLLNHVRLLTTIANDRGVFGGDPPITHRHVAKWVLLSELAPRLAAALTSNPSNMADLETVPDVTALQTRLDSFSSGLVATTDLEALLKGGVRLAPVLGRLVTFQPA